MVEVGNEGEISYLSEENMNLCPALTFTAWTILFTSGGEKGWPKREGVMDRGADTQWGK